MIEELKKEAELAYTENGAVTNFTSGSDCLDLFFESGAMRNAKEIEIGRLVLRAYIEDPLKTLKIIFFARDIRGGLGERRFFRTAIKALSAFAPEAIKRNIHNFAEYGRYDDLCVLLGTACEEEAVALIQDRLYADIQAMKQSEAVSLIAKWLPSVNASSPQTKANAKHLAKKLGMSEKEYRLTLSALRKYIDIIEDRLRRSDYTFDYEKQPSGALFKYIDAFFRNDEERYTEYLNAVSQGKAKMNASTLYPYDIIRKCLCYALDRQEIKALDAAWNNLPSFGSSENAIAVVDGSYSMTCGSNSVRPIDAALSLGIYFAEHNTGRFANHFITFSMHPRLVEVKGSNIAEKAKYCATFNEVANTNIEAVFDLILKTAVKNKMTRSDMPSRIYIISDMEFDCCINHSDITVYNAMEKKYKDHGYPLPQVIFWNVNGRTGNLPVRKTQTDTALVSGFSPAIFEMITGDISPEKIMNDIIFSERYAAVG